MKDFEKEYREWLSGDRISQSGEEYVSCFIEWINAWDSEDKIYVGKGYMFPCEIVWSDGWDDITIAFNGKSGFVNVFQNNGLIEPNFISVEDKSVTEQIASKLTQLFGWN